MSFLIDDINEHSCITLLSDIAGAGALGLLKMLLCKSSREKIHLLLFEFHSEDFLDCLPHDVQSRITVHDFAGDPLGWLGGKERCIDSNLLTYTDTHCTGSSKEDILIVIDSLTNLINLRSLSYTCQVIHAAAHRSKSTAKDGADTQVIVGVHRDLHDLAVLSQLEHIANTVITVTAPVSPGFTVACSILNKKVTGKILKTKQEYKLGNKFDLVECQEVTSVIKPTAVEPGVDPTANLTFKLSLCESEKEARSRTQLPYVYDKLRQSEVLKKSVGEGKVFYQPDEADDFDEDDPDDDLEI